MAELHGLWGLPTTYDTWDDPPSSTWNPCSMDHLTILNVRSWTLKVFFIKNSHENYWATSERTSFTHPFFVVVGTRWGFLIFFSGLLKTHATTTALEKVMAGGSHLSKVSCSTSQGPDFWGKLKRIFTNVVFKEITSST